MHECVKEDFRMGEKEHFYLQYLREEGRNEGIGGDDHTVHLHVRWRLVVPCTKISSWVKWSLVVLWGGGVDFVQCLRFALNIGQNWNVLFLIETFVIYQE